jgi:hypothetical protein
MLEAIGDLDPVVELDGVDESERQRFRMRRCSESWIEELLPLVERDLRNRPCTL